jgi:urease gamma subunit
MVQGKYPTLREAVLDHAWPSLREARGKIVFVLDAGEDITAFYLAKKEAKRPMFVNVDSSHAQAAFFIMNDPVKQEKEIQDLVNKGFMIRTRSDVNTVEARTGDKSRFEAAIRSGAQLISTDYYVKSLSPNQDFEIVFEDGTYSQCNPILRKGPDCNM